MAKSNWTVMSSTGPTRGRSLEGVSTASLGVMYTRGDPVAERPDEPWANNLTRRDRELQHVSDASLRATHSHVRAFPLPDGSQLVVDSKRPFEELSRPLGT